MDISTFARNKIGSADTHAEVVTNIVRSEVVVEADDGQQYIVILLDADDSFDVVVHYPNGQREAVFSVTREREGQ
jgi:hypothetical protein